MMLPLLRENEMEQSNDAFYSSKISVLKFSENLKIVKISEMRPTRRWKLNVGRFRPVFLLNKKRPNWFITH